MSTNLSEVRYYTGIGSRETPPRILSLMRNIAIDMAVNGFILRSGHADGADYAFEMGTLDCRYEESEKLIEIFTPWSNFTNKTSNMKSSYEIPLNSLPTDVQYYAAHIAEKIHKNWSGLSSGAKKLHTRNILQVLGVDLNTPSSFVLYWAKEDKSGNVNGGTRTAVMLARAMNIPTINMYFDDWNEKLLSTLGELDERM